ncbi:MAG: hypothetical protein MI923_07330 [Phycisphaerales bacterium]|nr:hypothetical protein [Phycisphaerales bacterium]
MRAQVFLIAVLAFVSPANANQVWFETADGLLGGPGQVLELTINTADSPTSTTFEIVAKANVTELGWGGFGVDLFGDPADAGKLSASNWTNLSPFTQSGSNGVGGSAPDLMTGGFHLSFINGIASGEFDLFSFTLTKEKAQGDSNISEVEFVVGVVEFAQGDFLNPIASFDVAGNGVIFGDIGVSGGTVIRITNIPEPATLPLFGFCAIAILRRGRF